MKPNLIISANNLSSADLDLYSHIAKDNFWQTPYTAQYVGENIQHKDITQNHVKM